MNHREPTSVPQGMGQTFPCLALLLLSLLSGGMASAHPRLPLQAGLTQQKTYLVALGAPPLRFQEPASDAALVRPPSPGSASVTAPESSTHASTADVTFPATEAAAKEPSSESVATIDTNPGNEPEIAASQPSRSPLPILPDDARPQARPEDFLPYFQIPVNQSDVNLIVPAARTPSVPNNLPYSSATYRQR
jgi:hypothetical protein